MPITHQAIKEALFASTPGNALVATDAILTTAKNVNVYDGDKTDIPSGFDEQDQKQVNNNPSNVFDFTLNTAGSGTAGTPPEIAGLLKAAGGKEDTGTAGHVIYTKETVQANIPGIDLALNQIEAKAGIDYWYTAPNAKGNIGISFSEGGVVEIKGDNFIGDYVRPAESAAVAPDFATQNTRIALPANADNIIVATIDGKAICMSDWTANSLWYAGGVNRQSLPGGCKSTSHEDGINDGSATIMEPDWATLNLWELQDQQTEVAFSITIGTTPGLMITVSCPRVQIIGVQKSTIGKLSAKGFTPRYLAPLELDFH